MIFHRHWSLGDLFVVDLPDVSHVHHADPADRAGVVTVGHHLVKTSLVDEVIAGGDLEYSIEIRQH